MEIVKVEAEEKKIYFRFPPSPPASQKVVEIENLGKSYDELEVFTGLDLRIEKGDRIAVVGVNGAGKSTLVRILAGVEPFQKGTRDVGVNTVIGYFAQHQAEELNPENDVLTEVEEVLHDNPDANPRAALGALLFSGNDVFKKTSVLSGGERNRVALAKLLMKPCNFLIMDEPTNHLDIRSKEVLQEALNLFDGAAIIVSHDRFFLDGVVTKVLEVSPTRPGCLPATSPSTWNASIPKRLEIRSNRVNGRRPDHGQTVFSLFLDERRQIHCLASGEPQLWRARNVHHALYGQARRPGWGGENMLENRDRSRRLGL